MAPFLLSQQRVLGDEVQGVIPALAPVPVPAGRYAPPAGLLELRIDWAIDSADLQGGLSSLAGYPLHRRSGGPEGDRHLEEAESLLQRYRLPDRRCLHQGRHLLYAPPAHR